MLELASFTNSTLSLSLLYYIAFFLKKLYDDTANSIWIYAHHTLLCKKCNNLRSKWNDLRLAMVSKA